MAVTMRTDIAHFLNGNRCGTGWIKLSENPGANTEETKYINMAASYSEVTDYTPKYGFQCDLMQSEASIAAVYNIAKSRSIGEDAVLPFVTCDLTTHKAWGEMVAVSVSSFDGDKKMQMSGELAVQGDAIEGTCEVNEQTKAITWSIDNFPPTSGSGT